MNSERDDWSQGWTLRIVAVLLGFAFLFIGSSGESNLPIWLWPASLVAILIVCYIGRHTLPAFASWFNVGITILFSFGFGLLCSVAASFLLFMRFDTAYAPGYSEKAFQSVRIGESEEKVIGLLGKPVHSFDQKPYTAWIYSSKKQSDFAQHGIGKGTYTTIRFDHTGRVVNVSGQTQLSGNSFRYGDSGFLSIREDLTGRTPSEIKEKFGSPSSIYEYKAWKEIAYSWSPSSGNYHMRKLGIDADGKVVHKWSGVYFD